MLTACHDADRPITELRPPPGFEQLEPTVREQFDDLRAALTRLRTTSPPASDRDLARAWGELGQWFHVYRFPNRATFCYREARGFDPDDPRWPYYLGLLAVNAGDLERAGSVFEAAADLAPGETPALLELAKLMAKRHRLDEAEDYYRRVLTLKPGEPSASIGMAQLHLQRQNANRALDVLRPLLSADRRGAGDVHYLMAQAHRLLGDGERARWHLDRYRERDTARALLNSHHAWLDELSAMNVSSKHLTQLGTRAYRRGNYRSAAIHAGRAVRANPENPELRVNYAAALLALGRIETALEQLDRALAQNPGLARAYLVKGSCYLRLGDRTRARDALLQAVSLDPGLKDARRQLGRVYQQQGRTELAIGQYAELRAGFEDVRQARFWHAALLASLGRYAGALSALDEDLEVLPHSRLLQLLRIRLLAAAGDAAVRDPARAAELLAVLDTEPADVYFAETAAMVAAANGDHARAIDWQRRAVQALESVSQKEAGHIGRRRLMLYRENKACLTPWEPGELLITKPVDNTVEANRATS